MATPQNQTIEEQGEVKVKRAVPYKIIIVVLVVGAGLFALAQFASMKKDPQAVAQEEVRSLVAQVGRLMILPEGEDPTVATVTDPDRLKDQAFFINAKKGDKVLIYSGARKAILYSPDGNKIVEVAPIAIGAPEEAAPVAPSAPSASSSRR